MSYYLGATCGWTRQNAVKGLVINTNETKNESSYWYKRGEEDLLICGVGGKDNFGSFFKEKIINPMTDSTIAFSRIAVVTDRDNRQISSICDSFKSIFKPVISSVENNVWRSNNYTNSYRKKVSVDFLLLIIPHEKEGALESLLLDAISENAYDKVIVDKSIEYVDNIEPCALKYIKSARLKLKAYLGVSWAIQYPEKVTTLMSDLILSVRWEDSKILDECFKELKQI